jgi:hypothetical protein
LQLAQLPRRAAGSDQRRCPNLPAGRRTTRVIAGTMARELQNLRLPAASA